MIGIICALPKEADSIIEEMTDIENTTIGNVNLNAGLLYGKDVVVAVCGMGKVSAAMCAQIMIVKYRIDEIINVGIAGALTKDLKVFDVVVADRLCQHDVDTSPIGDPVGFISGINQIYFPTCERINNILIECLRQSGDHFVHGTIASGDQFIATEAQKERILENFDAVACEMEGGAIAQVCFTNGVDFAVLRSISDSEGGDVDYIQFSEAAAKVGANLIKEYIKKR